MHFAFCLLLLFPAALQAAGWQPRDFAPPGEERQQVYVLPAATGAPQGWMADNVLPIGQRVRFRNPDGSCVQAALGMGGVHHNKAAMEALLWPSEYGGAVRGGSTPARVEAYCRERQIDVWIVTGRETMRWIDAALDEGRYVGITWGAAHMITAVGRSADGETYFVCDNNSPERIDQYGREKFVRNHLAGGSGWAVIPKGPAPAPWVGPEAIPGPKQ